MTARSINLQEQNSRPDYISGKPCWIHSVQSPRTNGSNLWRCPHFCFLATSHLKKKRVMVSSCVICQDFFQVVYSSFTSRYLRFPGSRFLGKRTFRVARCNALAKDGIFLHKIVEEWRHRKIWSRQNILRVFRFFWNSNSSLQLFACFSGFFMPCLMMFIVH